MPKNAKKTKATQVMAKDLKPNQKFKFGGTKYTIILRDANAFPTSEKTVLYVLPSKEFESGRLSYADQLRLKVRITVPPKTLFRIHK